MLTIFSKTDIGRKRSLNQDRVYTCSVPIGNLPNLFIVADGMGGHKAGDYASAYTVKAIEREVMLNESTEPVKIIREAVSCANSEIYEKSANEIDYSGMGTTVVVATIVESILYVANVGDSRLYIIDDGIQQITKDHSLVEEMIRMGEIERESARLHPKKNIITRAIGASEDVDIDFFEVGLKDSDIILMCTDGLTNMVDDEEIFSVIRSAENVDRMGEELIKHANHSGGKDNIGVVLVKVTDEGVREC